MSPAPTPEMFVWLAVSKIQYSYGLREVLWVLQNCLPFALTFTGFILCCQCVIVEYKSFEVKLRVATSFRTESNISIELLSLARPFVFFICSETSQI